MFFFKKLIAAFLMPTPIVAALIAAGLALLWFTKRQRAGKVLVSVGLGLLLLASNPGVAALAIGPLEARYPALFVGDSPTELDRAAARARFIVVLGAGHFSDPHRPPTEQLSASASRRLLEGLRLRRHVPDAKLVVSGYGGGDPVPHAEVAAHAARAMGVSEDDIILHPRPRDTEEEARAIKATVGTSPFIVVTSARHLPRAVRLLRKQGLDPIPAPADYTSGGWPGLDLGSVIPSPASLQQVHAAIHEWLGTAWSGLRGTM